MSEIKDIKTEAYFMNHCEDPPCGLGAFKYVCPCCGKNISDYDIWWKQDDIWEGKREEFKCEKCNKLLMVEWDKNKFEYWVNAL